MLNPTPNVHVAYCKLHLLFTCRLQSLSKQSLADSQFVAGIHPEADPEQSAGIFAVLTGEKSLPEKWAVRCNYVYTSYIQLPESLINPLYKSSDLCRQSIL